jgi:hypothetical protein
MYAFDQKPMYWASSAPNDWVIGKDGKPYWDPNATSQETTKDGEKWIGKTGTYSAGGGIMVDLYDKDKIPAGQRAWSKYYEIHDNHDPVKKADDPKEPIDPLKQILDGTSLGGGAVETVALGMETFTKDPTTREVAQKFGKYLGVAGKVLGVASLANDIRKISNKGFSKMTIYDGAKLGLSIMQIALKVNPGVSLVYGVADAMGYNPVDLIENYYKK